MLLLLFTIVVLYFVYCWITLKPRNFPPGPPALPILGSFPFLKKKHMHLDMQEWNEKYGGAVGLVFGQHLTVAVCSSALVREVLKREEFQGRPNDKLLQERSFNRNIGIMFADGEAWQEQRRFTLRHLKEFGFGKTSMEDMILEEIAELSEEIGDQRLQVSGLFNLSSVNVLWSIVAGIRYKRSDPSLQNLMLLLTELFRAGNVGSGVNMLLAIFPFLRHVFPKLNEKQSVVTRHLNKLFEEVIRQHEKTLDKNNPRDFIDVYLSEMHSKNGQVSSFDEQTLITICTDLFTAGSESVGNTLGFAILYMVLHPEIQAKVHAAIDAEIGSNRPSLHDRTRIPYVEAALLEVQRCNTIAPLTVPHRATKDTMLNGYFIPQDTMLLPSVWSIAQDKEHWGDPENFRPSRFLDGNGKIVKDEFFIPFGVGKRLCPGEALARNVLFLFFTSLMQKFSFHLPNENSKPGTLSLPGFTTAPEPFEVIFKSRQMK